LFYGAGATGRDYEAWQKVVAADYPELELLVFEYPGHGNHNVEFETDADELMKKFDMEIIQTVGIKDWFDCPFILVGCSTGARFAYGFLKEFIKVGIRPEKLYIVARTPPVVEDKKWVVEQPSGTIPLLNWVSDELVTSMAERLKKMWPQMPETENEKREQMWRSDLRLNCGRIPPCPREWKVVATGGKLVSKSKASDEKMVQKKREPGSVVHTTGEELAAGGAGSGARWVHVDAARDATGKGGWLLTNGKAVGNDEDLLEPVEGTGEASPDDVFWKSPITIQVHYSEGDQVQMVEDKTGRIAPMKDWSKLAQKEPEMVKYEDMVHNVFIMHDGVLRNVCDDVCKLLKYR